MFGATVQAHHIVGLARAAAIQERYQRQHTEARETEESIVADVWCSIDAGSSRALQGDWMDEVF